MKMLSRAVLILLATCCLSLAGCGDAETAPAKSDAETTQTESDTMAPKGDGSGTKKEEPAKADGSGSK